MSDTIGVGRTPVEHASSRMAMNWVNGAWVDAATRSGSYDPQQVNELAPTHTLFGQMLRLLFKQRWELSNPLTGRTIADCARKF
jgi:hypothetical protein